jgi:hypothetical protein
MAVSGLGLGGRVSNTTPESLLEVLLLPLELVELMLLLRDTVLSTSIASTLMEETSKFVLRGGDNSLSDLIRAAVTLTLYVT